MRKTTILKTILFTSIFSFNAQASSKSSAIDPDVCMEAENIAATRAQNLTKWDHVFHPKSAESALSKFAGIFPEKGEISFTKEQLASGASSRFTPTPAAAAPTTCLISKAAKQAYAAFPSRGETDLTLRDFTLPESFLSRGLTQEDVLATLGSDPVRVFFDTETTGISNRDRVIQIAAISRNYATMKERKFCTLVNPEGYKSNPRALDVHKIPDLVVAGAPLFSEIAPSLFEFFADHTLVAHNVKFDRRMINNELSRISHDEIPKERFYCTLEQARKVSPGEINKLDAVADRYGVDLSKRATCHDALVDTEILADVFPFLITNTK